MLRTLLSRLRAALGEAAVAGRSGVRLALPEPVSVDVLVAEEAVAAACGALEEHDFLTAFGRAQEALEVLRRELLPGHGGDWLEGERLRLAELRLEALEYETLAGSRLGAAARAVALRAGRELVDRAPYRESGYVALMQAHAAAGNVAEAIRLYVALRDLLRRDLGTAPGRAVVALYERLLAGEPATRTEPAPYEGSPDLLRRTLTAVERASPVDPGLRCELLLELGASLERTGAGEPAREAFAEAADMARQLGRADLLAVAAVGYGGRGIPFAPGVPDHALVALLEEAIDALDEAQTPLRVRLLARMATALSGATDVRRRTALADEAVGLARRLGDPHALACALSARHLAAWSPDNLEQRTADAVELVGLTSAGAELEAVLPGHLWLFTDRLEAGDLDGADEELQNYARVASELGHPGYLWWGALLRAMRHFMAGRFADAERCAERVLALAPRTPDAVVAQAITVQVVAVRKEGGDLASVVATVRATSQRYPEITAWRCLLAYVYGELGRSDEARAELEPLVAQLDALPRDHLWLIAIALLADACAALDDAVAARVLRRRLEPYTGRVVVGLGGLWFGPVDHHLALLARTERDFAAAERYFERAVATSRSMGARPWLGHTLREWAAALALRAAPGDRERGGELLDEAARIADELDMVDLRRAVARVRAALRAPAGA